MPLFDHQYLSSPAISGYDLDRFLRSGYRVVVLSSAVYDRYRRFPDLYPVQNAFFNQVTKRAALLVEIGPRMAWCCPETLNAQFAEAAARIWGRPGPTLRVYQFPAGD
jgi:hypothetical protein